MFDGGPSSLRVDVTDQIAAGASLLVSAAVYEDIGDANSLEMARRIGPHAMTARLGWGEVETADDGVAPDVAAADGIYTARLVAPGQASTSELLVRIAGINSAGVHFERACRTAVTVAEPRASLTGDFSYRTELAGDGMVEALLVDVGVAASSDCTVEVSGDVVAQGSLAAQAAAQAVLREGENAVLTLRVEAASLYASLGADGVFVIDRVVLEIAQTRLRPSLIRPRPS